MIAVAFFAAAGLTVFAYWPGLAGPFILDDGPQLGGLITQSGLPPSFLINNYLISDSGPLGRPVSMATFILDAIAYGSNTWWWKYHSLLLHVVAGTLLFWFLGLIASHQRRADWPDPWILALVAATVWLLHPLLVSTVLYTVQRMTILSTLFVFAGLTAYTKGRLLHLEGRTTGWILVSSAFIVFVPLAAASKENGILLAGYCTLLEFCVFSFAGSQAVRRPLYWLHGSVVVAGLIGVLLLAVNPAAVADSYGARDFTAYQRLLSEFRALSLYLELILIPLPVLMGFFHDDFDVSRGLFDPASTAFSIVLILLLIVSAFLLRGRNPLFAFGILFFFASHLLESTVFALELVFEHRNYVGSAGIILAVTSLVATRSRSRGFALGTILVIGSLTFLTWQRSDIWSTPQKMYRHMYAVHPDSPRVNSILAHASALAGEFADARQLLAGMKPALSRQLTSAYFDCLEYGHVEPNSLPDISSIDRPAITPHVTYAIEALVEAARKDSCDVPLPELLATIDQLENTPAHSERAYRAMDFAKAQLLELEGDIDGAVDVYMVRQMLADNDAVPTYLLADMLARQGRYAESREQLLRAAQIENRSRVVRKDLAESIYTGIGEHYSSHGDVQNSLETYREAIASVPDSPRLRLAYAENLIRSGNLSKAQQELRVVRLMDLQTCYECANRLDQLAASLTDTTSRLPES